MNCPRCETSPLDERERDGVTIDVCRQCRGLWLDRGELEKLIARSLDEHEACKPRGGHHGQEHGPFASDDKRGGDHGHRKHPDGRHRKKNFFESLGDLFD